MKILFRPLYVAIVTKSVIRIIAIYSSPMTRKESDGYHPQLFLDEVFNDSSGSSNSGTGDDGIFRQLETIASQRVADTDYEQQIERWNQYQELLDKVEKKCTRQSGVRISRNIKHNVKTFTETAVAGLGFIALISSMSLVGSYTMNSIYGIIGSAIALGFIGWQSFIRVHHPSIINFKCSPILHIDEFAYMRQAIKAIPSVEHDPIVKLPAVEMAIPRTWLGQQSMLKFMESLSNLGLEKEGRRGKTDRIL